MLSREFRPQSLTVMVCAEKSKFNSVKVIFYLFLIMLKYLLRSHIIEQNVFVNFLKYDFIIQHFFRKYDAMSSSIYELKCIQYTGPDRPHESTGGPRRPAIIFSLSSKLQTNLV